MVLNFDEKMWSSASCATLFFKEDDSQIFPALLW